MKTVATLTIVFGVILTTTVLFSSSSFHNSPRCEKKASNIQEQINIARDMNNSKKVNGLEISLLKVRKYCTDDNLIEKINDKISETREDLLKHKKDYKEALVNNDTDKIEKYQSKIINDHAKIKRLKSQLFNKI